MKGNMDMIQFGGGNEEITKNCPNAPFLLSLEDDPDGRLRIVIALPQRGEEGEGVDELKKISCLENKDTDCVATNDLKPVIMR